jgi:membrane-bound lytic murein transglycosylase B
VQFHHAHQDLLTRAAQRFGVPTTIITAILGVETLYGRNMGHFRVLDTLTALAFQYPDPNKPERAALFREQLSDFLTLVLAGKLDLDARGSYAGAIGMPQFMPSSIQRYALDSDKNGHIDLCNNIEDIVMSVGNFLFEHGWQRDVPVFAPVILPADPAPLVEGGITPTLDWQHLRNVGALVEPEAASATWITQPLGVIDLPDETLDTVQFRTATPNFFALTQYNPSYFYAAAVADLAAALDIRAGE